MLTYHKYSQAEYATQNKLPTNRKATSNKHLKSHSKHRNVGRYVEDCIGDQMICSGIALDYTF